MVKYAKYYVSGLKYGWRMARGRDKIVFFSLVPMQALLVPVFVCMPSYRAQVREWWEQNGNESNVDRGKLLG